MGKNVISMLKSKKKMFPLFIISFTQLTIFKNMGNESWKTSIHLYQCHGLKLHPFGNRYMMTLK